MTYDKRYLKSVQQAFRNRGITLYLGAGSSVESGIPSWEKLVALMYYAIPAIQNTNINLRPFPNYLFAIAEWHLKRNPEPLEITARKIRASVNAKDFLLNLKNTLYAKLKDPEYDDFDPHIVFPKIEQNNTLQSIISLITSRKENQKGVKTVITYNYDNLLELALGEEGVEFLSIWKKGTKSKFHNKLPIYHVHGFVPIETSGSKPDDIIFTEDKYHQISHNSYDWSNLVQIRQMSSSTGLMIGLSLTDRNMRSILDAIKKAPIETDNYLLLKEPHWDKPDQKEIDSIHQKASEYWSDFINSGIKTDSSRINEILQITEGVTKNDKELQEKILNQMGLKIIWYQDYEDIPKFLRHLITA